MRVKTRDIYHNENEFADKINELEEFVLNENELFEMANLHPMDTGLPSTLYATFNGKEIIKQRAPRVKVETSSGWLSIIIGDTIKLSKKYNLKKEDQYKVKKAVKYIKQHKQSFLNHWNGLITDRGLADELFNGKKTERINKKY